MITTTIEIDAPPSKVRSVLLDFPNLHTYHTGLFKGIEPLDSSSYPDPSALTPGKQLLCKIGPPFVATITQNSPNCFEWKGPPNYGILNGVHTFTFEDSNATPGGTTLVQSEEFWGVLFWAMNPWLMGRLLRTAYEGFNEDLKKGVEGAKEVA
ncbi:MAG: hypothetical protein ASARMPRED_002575 [Alectoria sarmentosa]|nr:MAG: hypothetical protein ASARMPRED_002575 [Alectoria sarmentosa]